jgi:hypothetical protein
MKTKGSREKRKVWDKIYYEKHCKSVEKKEAKRKYDQERRGEHQQCVESQEEEEVEEEEDQSDCWERMEKAGAVLMSDPTDIPWYTSLDLEMFNNLVEQCSDHLKMTTEKGKERLKFNSAVPIPVCTFIFMTLFGFASIQHLICSQSSSKSI